jgi:hypothetical protein
MERHPRLELGRNNQTKHHHSVEALVSRRDRLSMLTSGHWQQRGLSMPTAKTFHCLRPCLIVRRRRHGYSCSVVHCRGNAFVCSVVHCRGNAFVLMPLSLSFTAAFQIKRRRRRRRQPRRPLSRESCRSVGPPRPGFAFGRNEKKTGGFLRFCCILTGRSFATAAPISLLPQESGECCAIYRATVAPTSV